MVSSQVLGAEVRDSACGLGMETPQAVIMTYTHKKDLNSNLLKIVEILFVL